MVNLELEPWVNIKPAKQEIEMEGELNRHGFAKQQRRMLLIVPEICQLWVLPCNFILSPGRLYVLLEQDI